MKIPRYLGGDSKIDLAKFHGNRLKIDREIGEKHAIQINVMASIGLNTILKFKFRKRRVKITLRKNILRVWQSSPVYDTS